MKRLFLAPLMVLGLIAATAGCSPALAQCAGGACSVASAVVTSQSFQSCNRHTCQSCGYTECSPGHGRHSRRCRQVVQVYQGGSCQACQTGQCEVVTQAPMPAVTTTTTTFATASNNSNGSDDALAEVNAKRATKGLRPLLPDPLLTQGALACAKQRAARHISGHLPESDFSYLPSGGHATAAGCGALEDSWGWETCCYDDPKYTYCGAAWVRGSDGLRYMHVMVR